MHKLQRTPITAHDLHAAILAATNDEGIVLNEVPDESARTTKVVWREPHKVTNYLERTAVAA